MKFCIIYISNLAECVLHAFLAFLDSAKCLLCLNTGAVLTL